MVIHLLSMTGQMMQGYAKSLQQGIDLRSRVILKFEVFHEEKHPVALKVSGKIPAYAA